MNQQPTRHADVNRTVTHLARELETVLGDNFIGLYVQGSIALGAFDPYSDVDFLIAVHEDIPNATVPALEAAHRRVYDSGSRPAQHLEGSYFPAAILRHDDPPRTPLLYLDNGSRSLERSLHDNDLVVRWITREHGITVTGPAPNTLIDPVPPQALKDEMRHEIHAWSADIFSGAWSALPTIWGQAFAVVSFCRMLHTVHTGEVYSKPDSVQWALQHLPECWHTLIREAQAARPVTYTRGKEPVDDPQKADDARAFIRYLLNRDDIRRT